MFIYFSDCLINKKSITYIEKESDFDKVHQKIVLWFEDGQCMEEFFNQDKDALDKRFDELREELT